jgi:maleate cis-trans isomerase
MIGYRARLGLILPSLNTTTESEFYRCLPEGVTAHFTRMSFEETTPAEYESMIDDVPAGASMLSHVKPSAIMFACTSGSLYGGVGYDRTIISKIKANTDIPASTTSTAVLDGFAQMGVRKVAVATPYLSWVDDLEKQFFETGGGVEVVNIKGLGLRGFDVGEVTPETIYQFAKEQDRPDADALFISCMGLRTLEVVPMLERDLNKPVLSSNQVTLWKLLTLANVSPKDVKVNFGSLFSS